MFDRNEKLFFCASLRFTSNAEKYKTEYNLYKQLLLTFTYFTVQNCITNIPSLINLKFLLSSLMVNLAISSVDSVALLDDFQPRLYRRFSIIVIYLKIWHVRDKK